MAYVTDKVSETIYDLTLTFSASFVITITSLTPNTHNWEADTSVTITTSDGTVSSSDNVHTFSASGTYRFTFPDGVYKLSVVEDGGTASINFIIVADDLIEELTEITNSIISCDPDVACSCNNSCDKYYNYVTLALFAITHFGKKISPNFDYQVRNSGALYIQERGNINGYNEETLNDVLYARTAYRSIEQLEECEE